MLRKILLTGFEPFGQDCHNPSEDIVRALDDAKVGRDYQICGKILPVVKGTSVDKVTFYIKEIAPEFVIMLGQAAGRNAITPEKVAINFENFPLPDNGGHQSLNTVVREDGPDAYFTNLPVNAMVHHIREAGVKSELSFSAGTFVCNHVFYGVLHYIRTQNLQVKAGFIHIPRAKCYSPAEPLAMDLELMTKAVKKACEAAVKYESDLQVINGCLD